MAQLSGAALALYAVVLFLSCVGALGVRRADQLISSWNVSSSKAFKADYRDYYAGVVIFGDSTVDVGVNNYLLTVAKSNFKPYGRIFEASTPTGRFCDGKLSIDYIGKSALTENHTVECEIKRSLVFSLQPLEL